MLRENGNAAIKHTSAACFSCLY